MHLTTPIDLWLDDIRKHDVSPGWLLMAFMCQQRPTRPRAIAAIQTLIDDGIIVAYREGEVHPKRLRDYEAFCNGGTTHLTRRHSCEVLDVCYEMAVMPWV